MFWLPAAHWHPVIVAKMVPAMREAVKQLQMVSRLWRTGSVADPAAAFTFGLKIRKPFGFVVVASLACNGLPTETGEADEREESLRRAGLGIVSDWVLEPFGKRAG
ncbi:MAG: hypothetical protein Rhob2KO_19690 [Rhodopirellula baltica]